MVVHYCKETKIEPRHVIRKTSTQVFSKAIDAAKCCRHGSFTSIEMATEPTVPGKLCSAKLMGAYGCHLLFSSHKRVTMQSLWGSCSESLMESSAVRVMRQSAGGHEALAAGTGGQLRATAAKGGPFSIVTLWGGSQACGNKP